MSSRSLNCKKPQRRGSEDLSDSSILVPKGLLSGSSNRSLRASKTMDGTSCYHFEVPVQPLNIGTIEKSSNFPSFHAGYGPTTSEDDTEPDYGYGGKSTPATGRMSILTCTDIALIHNIISFVAFQDMTRQLNMDMVKQNRILKVAHDKVAENYWKEERCLYK